MRPSELPLLNKRIVVTRADEQSDNVVSLLKEIGATVISLPTIKIVPVELSSVDRLRIEAFHDYDVVIFSSANSAKNLFTRIHIESRRATKPYIIAVGKKTAETISEYGYIPDFVPGKFNSKELMKSLADFEWKSKKVLIPAGNLSNGDLAEFVKSKGGFADQVIVYTTDPNDALAEDLKSEIHNSKFDMIVFYSPSQVKNFVVIFGGDILRDKQIAVIGPTTKKAVEGYCLDVAVIPENSTTEALISALVEHEKV